MIYIDLNDLMKNKTVNGKPLNMFQLAKETGISRTTLYNLKQGKGKGIEYPTLNTLVQYFGVPVGKIIKYSNQDENVNIDLYNYKQFYSEQDIKDFYNNHYNDLLNSEIKNHKKAYINHNLNEMKIFAHYQALQMVVNPIKKALFVKYTWKNKSYLATSLPAITENKNTINPVIQESIVWPTSFTKSNESRLKIGINYLKSQDKFTDLIYKYLPYNQQLFLLCKTIQFSGTLKDKVQLSTPKSKREMILNEAYENYYRDKRVSHVYIDSTTKNKVKHYSDNQQFILKLFNHGNFKNYRMTKEQILNYKQPSENSFNSSIYNFIIRDHTKE